MQVVEQCLMHPGECIATKSATGPFVDTGMESRYGERIYLRADFVEEMGEALGMRRKVEAEALEEAAERADHLEAALEELQAEHDRLCVAVQHTLYKGAVVEKKEGRDVFKLRPKRGDKAVDINAVAAGRSLEVVNP